MENVQQSITERPIPHKTAIVVGGSSGIGQEVCLRLAGRGWNVYNLSRTACKSAKVKNMSVDVVAGSTLSEAIDKIGEKSGIGALIYCAGFSMAAPVECAHENDVRYLFDVNYFGALKAVQAAIPYLKQSGGSIVLVSSVGGQLPIVFDSFYSSSKAALEMLARGLYGELKHYRIRVTAVLPGGTATAFTYKRKVYPDEENGSYSQDVKKAVAALANIEQGGMAAGEVAEAIYQCVVSEHPPVVKVCGAKNAFYVTMGKLSPQKVTLYLNQRMYNV